nr:histidine kinase dimerization/phosphoacceptor domain -containing protein [uncultured Rhodoferax sp.]
MKLPTFQWGSLKTKVTLLTLGIFVMGMTIVTVWTAHMLREDMRTMLEQQQFSIATIVAAEVNQELSDRLHNVELVAAGISPAMLANTSALQQYLADHRVLQGMFNAGTLVTRGDGTAVASVPTLMQHTGAHFMDQHSMAPLMAQGKSGISPVTLDKQRHTPMIAMIAPIFDPDGKLIGTLAGVINLADFNFFDKIIGNHHGQTGNYVLVSREQRMIVTGTNKRSVMQTLPSPGVNAMEDRFIAGFEGAGIGTTLAGEEVLVAAMSIPVANWYAAAHIPTVEAFAPIKALQQRMWLAIGFMTLFTASLTWWVLRRQLAPLVNTAAALAALPENSQFPAALPIAMNDEIGHLIAGFNQLLKTLGKRDVVLRDKQAQLDQLVSEQNAMLSNNMIGIVRVTQRVVQWANPAFVHMTGYPLDELVGQSTRMHYPSDEAYQALAQAAYPLLAGKVFHTQTELKRKDGSPYWADLSGALLQSTSEDTLWIFLDITERKQADNALQSSLRDKVALLNEVHHRVKNNLQVITSLLRLEAGRSSQPDTQAVLGEMQGRIRSMALLHETLYRSGIFASVNLAEYLKQLATQAFRAQSHGTVQLQLMLNAVHVSMDMATPCGLLVNELISNSLKHAFPDGRQGEVSVRLQPVDAPQAGGPTWCLCVSDNGVGLPANFEQLRDQSLGLQLATDLSRQLGSVLDIHPGAEGTTGARFSVRFTPDSTTAGRAHVPGTS